MNTDGHKNRILMVDDSPVNIRLLIDALQSDYELSVATSGPDALEIATSRTPPDLILLDIMMPGMDGYEVCRLLDKILLAGFFYGLTISVVGLMQLTWIARWLAVGSGLFSPWLALTAGVVSFRRGFGPARYFLFAWGALAAAVTVFAIQKVGPSGGIPRQKGGNGGTSGSTYEHPPGGRCQRESDRGQLLFEEKPVPY